MNRTRAFLLWLSLGSLLGFLLAPPASGQIGRIIPDQYIVVFRDDVADPGGTADSLTRPFGLTRQHLFRRVLKGFSAVISPTLLAAIQRDPRVRYVVPDQEVEAFAQAVPPGITRIGTGLNPIAAINGIDERVDIGIAIIDTGIDMDHPDLNVAGGVCITGSYYYIGSSCSSPEDQHGHGTHVAGTAAALDNDIGVVGVAPGARLYAVKVLDRNGSGATSQVIAGIDWVTQNAQARGIRVANMSLGGSGPDDGNCGLTNNDPMHTAICNSVAAGVTYVVAAGNNSADAKATVPAAYNEVITVSALVDTDGQAGGLGPSTSYGADDTFASFSNFGPDVDLIAPGVNVRSTYRNGGYSTLSGTSMATPHVAGAAALYLANNPGASPLQVREALINQGEPGPWPGDPDAIAESLVYVGAVHDVAVTDISAPAWVETDSTVSLDVTVTNTGTFEETAATLTLIDQTTGTVLGGPIDVGPLAPGGVFITSFPWTATPIGPHTILAQVSLAEDSNAANNSKSVTVEVKDPVHDVAVTGLAAPATAITGQAVQITVMVANLGTYDEGPFNVTLTDSATAQIVGSPTAVTLPAGSSAPVALDWTPATTGDHTLTATAALNGVDANLANDSKAATVAVSDVPFLVATVTTDKPSYTAGQTVKITTTVKNNAGSLVSGASVRVVITRANGSTTSKTGTTSGAGTFVWSWATSSYTGYLYGFGTYSVNATASKSGYQSGSGQTSFQLQ